MCRGFFVDDQPFLFAFLFRKTPTDAIPEKFLLDTGSNCTCITSNTAQSLGVNLDDVVKEDNCQIAEGIGGDTYVYPMFDSFGFLFVDESKELKKTSIHIEYLERIDLIPTLSMSILGRDILKRFDLNISTVLKTIELKRNDFGGEGHLCFSV